MFLTEYLQRIDYTGDTTPTLETLTAICAHHTTAIPFESISTFLKQAVRIDLPSIREKIIGGRRGGYCYEQNLLLRAALETMGYGVRCLAARPLWEGGNPEIAAHTHMALWVEVNNCHYHVDVGFGGVTPTIPLRLDTCDEQVGPHASYRITPVLFDPPTYRLEAQPKSARFEIGGSSSEAQLWKTVYHWTNAPQFEVDYKVYNWYVNTHPDSFFADNMMLARPDLGGRHSLLNRTYTYRPDDAPAREERVECIEHLTDLLRGTFRIQIGDELIGEVWEKTAKEEDS